MLTNRANWLVVPSRDVVICAIFVPDIHRFSRSIIYLISFHEVAIHVVLGCLGKSSVVQINIELGPRLQFSVPGRASPAWRFNIRDWITITPQTWRLHSPLRLHKRPKETARFAAKR